MPIDANYKPGSNKSKTKLSTTLSTTFEEDEEKEK